MRTAYLYEVPLNRRNTSSRGEKQNIIFLTTVASEGNNLYTQVKGADQ
jgi:hypothetical protein